MSTDWTFFDDILTRDEADKLYRKFVDSTRWRANGKNDRDALSQSADSHGGMNFGKPYVMFGGAVAGESPIPESLRWLVSRVEDRIDHPVNYVQCAKRAPNGFVLPHRDPGGVFVPMLALGQERAFRVGGDIDNETAVPQRNRKLEWHHFTDEVLMKHGRLLLFRGPVAHSMVPADDDSQFNPNGCEWRISLLFRWTTEITRKFGPGQKANAAGHRGQYARDVADWRIKRRQSGNLFQ